MREITKELIAIGLEDGWTQEEAEKGYIIATSKDCGNGATHIERIDCMEVFDGDFEASKQAELNGIKIIRDMKFKKEHIAAYIDTPENRELLKDCIEE